MTIITLIRPIFNRLHKNRLYGLDRIPRWHPLFGKKHHRCGYYIRKLRLYDKRIIEIVVYRFYCPELKKTYSLLPFFISRYERHINTVLEDVLFRHLVGKETSERLAEAPSPSPWTVKRWIGKFIPKLREQERAAESLLQRLHPLRPIPKSYSWSELFESFMHKARALETTQNYIYLYGSFSYINYAAGIQNTVL